MTERGTGGRAGRGVSEGVAGSGVLAPELSEWEAYGALSRTEQYDPYVDVRTARRRLPSSAWSGAAPARGLRWLVLGLPRRRKNSPQTTASPAMAKLRRVNGPRVLGFFPLGHCPDAAFPAPRDAPFGPIEKRGE